MHTVRPAPPLTFDMELRVQVGAPVEIGAVAGVWKVE
jgi:hypothetical protein